MHLLSVLSPASLPSRSGRTLSQREPEGPLSTRPQNRVASSPLARVEPCSQLQLYLWLASFDMSLHSSMTRFKSCCFAEVNGSAAQASPTIRIGDRTALGPWISVTLEDGEITPSLVHSLVFALSHPQSLSFFFIAHCLSMPFLSSVGFSIWLAFHAYHHLHLISWRLIPSRMRCAWDNRATSDSVLVLQKVPASCKGPKEARGEQ